MQPPDAAVALRSFARRYEEATRAAAVDLSGEPEPDEVDELANRIGSGGRSALDVVVDTARSLGALDRALEQALVDDSAVVNADVLDPGRRRFEGGHSGEFATEVELLSGAAAAMAHRIERADPHRWLHTTAVTGGGTSTPLAIAREAVRTARDHLEELRRILHEVRGRG